MSRVRAPSIAHLDRAMTLLQAIILGIVQGLTEFLPVSSSGHLALAQRLLGLENLHQYIIFDLVCHLGTLLAVLFVFRKTLQQLFVTQRALLFKVGFGTLPLFPLLFLIKPIKTLFDQPQFLGLFFFITALLLWCGIRF